VRVGRRPPRSVQLTCCWLDGDFSVIDVYRFLLALCVVQGHLFLGGPPGLAWQAVFSFYVLSGFLMTLVLNEIYGFGPRSFGRFFANRILRLYPAYYAVVLVTVLHIVFISPTNLLNGALSLPQTATEWLANVLIAGLVGIDQSQVVAHRLVPTAWSLTIELFCYALLAAYFARSKPRLWALLGGGLAITAVHFGLQFRTAPPDYGFLDHYVVLQAGLIPFAVGGLAYFHRRSRWFEPGGRRMGILALFLLLNGGLDYLSEFHRNVSGLYIAVALNLFLVPMLFRHDEMHRKQRWQVTLGGIAYPIFISHWFVGTLVFLQFNTLAPRGVAHCLLSLAASILVSLALYLGIDRNVEKLRVRLKRPPASEQRRWPGGQPVLAALPKLEA
jgi:peptidoglycan/LPS O-acetylase OafA/YrhL